METYLPLKDKNGDAIQCDGIRKIDERRCPFSSKRRYYGRYYCGVHYKLYNAEEDQKVPIPRNNIYYHTDIGIHFL